MMGAAVPWSSTSPGRRASNWLACDYVPITVPHADQPRQPSEIQWEQP